MQSKKKPIPRGGKYDKLKAPLHQLPAVNVCVEQVVRALVTMEYYQPDFREPVRTCWSELESTAAGTAGALEFVQIADVQIKGDEYHLRLHPRQVTACALLGVRAREVLAYLSEMKETVPDEPERAVITVMNNPRRPGHHSAHVSLAAVYAAVRYTLGLTKEVQDVASH